MLRNSKKSILLINLLVKPKLNILCLQESAFCRSIYASQSNASNKLGCQDITVKPFKDDDKNVWVGPPDPVSNLRLKVFPDSQDLCQEEKDFYAKSREVQDWNQEYWAEHNKEFTETRNLYIAKVSAEKNLPKEESLSAEEMSVFYKDFLDKNRIKHISYNWNWYKKNVYLIFLATKIKVSKCSKIIRNTVKLK
ncbi:hypothetical protein JTE90_021811 [Oedothorax gibbosus]|uniref:Apoptogenic protein 1, mitochondrial n=1 Tax=Oedothorax gibbosus TaxID=931172 RepID=A0AAV6TWW8_9ARAC|nr:hypothetical protein JTE90_021811 [Oedothorax gibbosus]